MTKVELNDYIIDINIQLSDAVEKMTRNKVKGLVVLKNNKVCGVFTRRDLVNCSHVFGIKNVSIKPFVNFEFEFDVDVVNQKTKNSQHSLIPIITHAN